LQRLNNALQKQNNELTSIILNLTGKTTVKQDKRIISKGNTAKKTDIDKDISATEQELLDAMHKAKETF
jgi:3-dehydroquinate dehydratase